MVAWRGALWESGRNERSRRPRRCDRRMTIIVCNAFAITASGFFSPTCQNRARRRHGRFVDNYYWPLTVLLPVAYKSRNVLICIVKCRSAVPEVFCDWPRPVRRPNIKGRCVCLRTSLRDTAIHFQVASRTFALLVNTWCILYRNIFVMLFRDAFRVYAP